MLKKNPEITMISLPRIATGKILAYYFQVYFLYRL